MYLLESHIVPAGTPPVRLSDYAVGIFEIIHSRKGIKKAIKRGQIRIDGKPAQSGDWIEPGQCLELYEREDAPPKPYELDLEVPFEDDYLAVVVKPAGLRVSGNIYQTLFNALSFNLSPSPVKDALPWPLPAHRLDKPTSGLVLIAKTHSIRQQLGRLFEQRKIDKTYHCLVIGKTPLKGSLNTPLDNKRALTHFERLEEIPSLLSGHLSLLRIKIETGRTHQIRRHLSEAGYPILGDRKYGSEAKGTQHKGLFLAATRLSFSHPAFAESNTKQQVNIEIPLPNKFESLIKRETRRWKKWRE
ncbi:MAG: RluA family pseudouridine synthase [Bacteroidetes bacterium]|nr:RluA family pseudouridine synthase [Bacteroidota bacterium]